jgi:hypothetical protein
LLLDDDREREGKCRALAGLRLDPDFAAMHLNDAALPRLRTAVLRRRVLAGSPPALERRLIASPWAQGHGIVPAKNSTLEVAGRGLSVRNKPSDNGNQKHVLSSPKSCRASAETGRPPGGVLLFSDAMTCTLHGVQRGHENPLREARAVGGTATTIDATAPAPNPVAPTKEDLTKRARIIRRKKEMKPNPAAKHDHCP